jgi:hypothetical protein
MAKVADGRANNDPSLARAAQMRRAADRAVEDPKALAKALRIVRTAIRRGVVSEGDLKW